VPGEAGTEAPIYRRLEPGDRLPTMFQACAGRPKFAFNTLAGRFQLFAFFLSADDAAIRDAVAAVAARRDLFDDVQAAFTGVSIVPGDRAAPGLADAEPGVRFAWDFDRSMSTACGAVPLNGDPQKGASVARKWVLVDPSLHVLAVWPMRETSVETVIAALEALPPPDTFGGVTRPAPVLVLPNVLEPDYCRHLIGLHEASGGGTEVGFFRDGKQVLDPGFKRRRDLTLSDPAEIRELNERLDRRVLPEIERLFFMRAHFIERHVIGCYRGEDGGHFQPHIDNGDPPTAHRRFAVSVNLNDGFDGGEIVFPEYGMAGLKPPPGWAVVFPCAILHAVRRVTSGQRYAFLPFLYDQSGKDLREANKGA
jgi:predicted 2-oxoglutarate/Fe(II)-dependent dioxygenase YbiX